QAYCSLGDAQCIQQKLEEAVAAYRKAIELSPAFTLAYNNLGVTLRDQKKLEEAIAAFRKAVQLSPTYALSRRNLQRTEQWLELEKKLPALLAKKERPTDAREALGLADFCAHYKQFFRTAVGFYRDAFRLEPKG